MYACWPTTNHLFLRGVEHEDRGDGELAQHNVARVNSRQAAAADHDDAAKVGRQLEVRAQVLVGEHLEDNMGTLPVCWATP